MQGVRHLFFELLQVAIGTRQSLSFLPTEKEWRELFEMSKRQALTAIAFAGANKCLCFGTGPCMNHISGGDGFSASPGIDENTYLKWLGLTAKVGQRNKEVNAACVKLVKQYAHDGIQCCILKGQGNLEYYQTLSNSPLKGESKDTNLGLCRTAGDIDVWCMLPSNYPLDGELDVSGTAHNCSDIRGVIEYVMKLHQLVGTKPHDGVRYHHVDAPAINGIRVEVHFRPLFLDSPIRNRRLQKWFKDNEQFGLHDAKIGDCVMPTPTNSFNVIYQLCHIYRHLFDEGVGLRQLLDYYFVLRALHMKTPSIPLKEGNVDVNSFSGEDFMGLNEEIMHTLSSFGMKKFAGAVMWVLAYVFDNGQQTTVAKSQRLPWMICEPNVKEGKFLLNEIMMAGNFGKYDDRIKHGGSQMRHAWEKTKHNLRLLTHYPEEVLWEPFFRVYHWIWRRLELWRY